MFDNEKLKNLTDIYLELSENKELSDLPNIEKIYSNLIEVINFHNSLYYINSNPIISDYQYDSIFSYLKKIEEAYPDIIKDYSPTQKLTFQIQKDFKTADHKIPMLSLENTYNAQDLTDWDEFISKNLKKNNIEEYAYVIEPKFDGVSIDIVYINGIFTQAITRGNGFIGEDVTENIKTLKSVPKKISTDIVELRIRGEIVMPKSQLSRINEERTQKGEMLFANTRNAASGSIRQLNANITAERGLVFYAYDLVIIDSYKENNEEISIKNLGFKTSDTISSKFDKFYTDINNIVEFCINEELINELESLDIEFDGLVIKTVPVSDNFEEKTNLRNKLGSTAHHPRRAVAYKFPAKQVITKLIGVTYSVGRTGIITPVANLETVNIGGVRVSNASLHNFDFISQKDIKLNDFVLVQRSGEVIPYVFGVVLEKRGEDIKDILPPHTCPVCNTEAIRIEEEAYYYCPNVNCPAVIKEKLTHFVSKDCMDIDGFGGKFIELFVDCGIIRHYADIYKLGNPAIRLQLKSLPLMGEKRIADLLKNTESSKTNNLWRIINAIGIRHIGKKTAKIIEEEIHKLITNYELQITTSSIDEIIQLQEAGKRITKKHQQEMGYYKFLKSVEGVTFENFDANVMIHILTDEFFLNSIFGIGKESIESLKLYLTKHENIQILKELQLQGVIFNNFEFKIAEKKLPLDGIHFSVTGKFEISRPKIVEVLQSFGAKWDEEPLKTTDFLLVGSDSGSKLKKAQENGIEIVEGISKITEKYSFTKEKFDGMMKSNKPQANSLF